MGDVSSSKARGLGFEISIRELHLNKKWLHGVVPQVPEENDFPYSIKMKDNSC
jgi:hypothetical protein